METYFTKVKVQADRYLVETEKPTIIVASCLKHALGNEEMTEEEFIAEYGVRSNPVG